MLSFGSFAPVLLFTLACGVASAQDKALLTASDQKSLRDKLVKLVDADRARDDESERNREKILRAYDTAKDAFRKEWDARIDKKGNLLASMVDLRAIFSNIFTYEKRTGVTPRRIDAKDVPPYALAVPKKYKNDAAWRTVLALPGAEESANKWVDSLRWLESTWDKSASLEDTVFHVPTVAKELDFDPAPDFSKPEGDLVEKQRIQATFESFGETIRGYCLDRNRTFLDAARGNCAFAVRLATYFPDRFAGLILREPTDIEKLRLGSLCGTSVLLLSSANTAAVCKQLKEKLDAVDPKICTVIETKDDYPFRGSTVEIETWMASVERNISRPKLVFEPNHEQYCDGYWVKIEAMDPLHTAPADKKPRLEVEADKAANRITITAVAIDSLYLTLNDSLVDLDKDFTVVVNGIAVKEKRTRDFSRMLDYVIKRFDADYLFPVQFKVRVPK